MYESNWQVEHNCPQCGAPVVLEETDRLFSCAHCRVKLFLACTDHCRYRLTPRQATRGEILYVPYWRFKGMAFCCESAHVSSKVVDTSYCATDLSFLPISLGFRPQTLKLRFVVPETPGNFLKASEPLPKTLTVEETAVHPPGFTAQRVTGCYHTLLGETLSCIYAPVFVQGGELYDAVLNRSLCTLPADGRRALRSRVHVPHWQPRFIATLCPHCGWDLEGERDSLVLLCRNCHSAWQAADEKLQRIHFEVFPGAAGASLHLPFWRMKAQVNGLQLQSYADLVRLANLPKVIRESWETEDFCFWSPAFKIRPGAFLQLAKLLTSTQIQDALDATLPNSPLYPVTFSAGEAAASMKVTLTHLAVAKERLLPLLPDLEMRLEQLALVYFPFALRGSEFLQSTLQLAIDRNALNFGRKL